MSATLEDYALIADCRGAALVSKGGAIDWWCAPRFDSPACLVFGELMDAMYQCRLAGRENAASWALETALLEYLVSNRVMQGRVEQARSLFERLLTLTNDVGLLAGEYDPKSKCVMGKFPQAFSHLALVDAAVSLSHVKDERGSHRLEPNHVVRPELCADSKDLACAL